jgi:peptidylamidoglycolate lyase
MKNYVCLVFAVFVLVVPTLAQTTNPNYEVTFLSEPPLGKAGWDRPRSVAADGNGLVYVLRPSDPPFSTEPQTPVIVFNRAGEVVNSWGDGLFPDAHSIDIDHEGFLWITDKDMHMVYKYTTDGQRLMALGKRGIAGDSQSRDAFNGPTDVAIAPNGDFFVADGQYGSRVVHFSKDGEFIKVIGGTKGSGPGEFDVPHAIALDSQGRLLVADEQPTSDKPRIQVFDQDGTFIEQWADIGLHLPTGLAVGPDGTVYVGDSRGNAIHVIRDGEFVEVIGSLQGRPHGITIDPETGVLYFADPPTDIRINGPEDELPPAGFVKQVIPKH